MAINVNASIFLDLKTLQYGTDSLFDGTLLFNSTGNYSADSSFIASTNSIDYNISLMQWINNSNVPYALNKGSYAIQGNPWTSKQILNAKGNMLAGFSIPSTSKLMSNFSLAISGIGDAKIDIGNDNKLDWQYSGQQIGWGDNFYPNGYSSSSTANSEAGIKGYNSIRRCEDINITFNDLLQSSKIRINVLAKKVASGADLNVSIANKECNIPDSNFNADTFSGSSCEVQIDNPKSQVYQVCAYSKTGDINTVYYKLPALSNYYFINLNIAKYNNTLNGNSVIYSDKLNIALQNILNKCAQDKCIVPIKFILDTDGQLNIDNILLRDKNFIDFNSMYDLSLAPDFISLSPVKLQLSKFYSLNTPNEKGSYDLKFKFLGETSNTLQYNVTDLPVAYISITPSSVSGINQDITFSGIKSYSKTGNITKYSWDFGDNQTAVGSIARHSYSKTGNYTVTLTIENNFGLKGSGSITMYIESLEKSIPDLINSVSAEINKAESNLASSSATVLETYKLLGYDSLIKKAKLNLTLIGARYLNVISSNETNKEESLNELVSDIDSIRNSVPLSIYVTVQKIENDFPDLEDIPSPEALKLKVDDIDQYNEQVYVFNQEHAKINTDIRKVDVIFINGKDNFTLVRKQITLSGSNLKVIENFGSFNINSLEILKPSSYSINDDFNLVEFEDESEVVYKSNNLVGKTVVIPSSIDKEESPVCGDEICNQDESKESCPEDCQKKSPWIFFIILGIVVLFGIYYINFYHGKGNFKDLGNYLSVKLRKKRLFTSQKDIENLSNYVRNMTAKGYKEEQIRPVLSKKGWAKEQVDYAFSKSREMQKFK